MKPEYQIYSFNEEGLNGFIDESMKLGVEYILKPSDGGINFLQKDHNYLFFFSSPKKGEKVIDAVRLNSRSPFKVMIKTDSYLIKLVNGTGSKKP